MHIWQFYAEPCLEETSLSNKKQTLYNTMTVHRQISIAETATYKAHARHHKWLKYF